MEVWIMSEMIFLNLYFFLVSNQDSDYFFHNSNNKSNYWDIIYDHGLTSVNNMITGLTDAPEWFVM